MTTEQIIGLTLTLLLMFVGLIGSIVPGLPGAPLALIAAIGHRLYFGQESASTWVLLVLTGLTAVSLVCDYVVSAYGAKQFGATWRGAVGAVVGGIIGLFFSLPGIILGPFLGALAFELMGGYNFDKASKAGFGAVLGLLFGVVGKCAICVVMIGMFTFSTILRS